MNETSLVLIDGQNVLKGWWEYCEEQGIQARTDYAKLRDALAKGTHLLRA